MAHNEKTDGIASDRVSVKSGVSQGMVLGLLMFYINDIGENVLSVLKFLWMTTSYSEQFHLPQTAVNFKKVLIQFTSGLKNEKLIFDINKYIALNGYKSASSISTCYHLNNHILECVKHHSYLGVILDQTMLFSPHINNIVSKASKILNFI